ncbi:unnamed protein product, partial [Adineta steineri]
MILFKIICIFGCFILMTHAKCNIAEDPLELVECLSHISTILIALSKNDIGRMCRSTTLITECAQSHISECIGERVCEHNNPLRIGIAAFNELKGLSQNCCPDRNGPNCSIRDSVINNQRCFSAGSLVTLSNGKQKLIAHLQSGDALLAYNHKTKQITSTHLITMLDFQPHQFAVFKQVTTSTGRQLSLT